MSTALSVGLLVDTFPLVSETFVVRHAVGLLADGHDVQVYAQRPAPADVPRHDEIAATGLADRTTYVDPQLPPAAAYWEQPVRPLRGETWLPEALRPLRNWKRVAAALPAAARCAARSPRALFDVLDERHYRYQARSLSALYRLDLLARHGRRHDIWHAHFGPTANTFRFVARLWRAPLVVSFHGYDFTSYVASEGPGVYRDLFREVAAVVVSCEWAQERLAALGAPAARIYVIPSGLDTTAFSFRQRGPRGDGSVRVLTVARLVPVKGIADGIRAFAMARRRLPGLRYSIVGDGPLRRELEDLARQLGVGRDIIFHGAANGAVVRQHLDDADLFMLPSTRLEGSEEVQGVVLHEAQASGLPVIATATGGVRQSIVDGGSGHLVAHDDPAGLAEVLVQLAGAPERWPAMGRCGRHHVEANFDLQKINRRLVELYEDLRDGPTSAAGAVA